MSRSSIFSSSTLRLRGLRPTGAALAVLLLVVVEIGLGRREWIWTAVRNSNMGLLHLLERDVIPSAPPPTVLLLGSSRMRDAVPPRALERALGLPESSVLNLGITSGTPLEALILYRRHRAKLSHAKVLVVSAEDWYANAGIDPSDSDRRFATLRERMTEYPLEESLGLVAGWLWRTYDARFAIARWLKCQSRFCEGSAYVGPDRRVVYAGADPLEGPAQVDVTATVSGFYYRYAWSDRWLKQLERLIAEAREDGLRVIVVQFPFRDAYLAAVRERHGKAYDDYLRAVRSLHGAEVLIYEGASEVGIAQRYFRDYGHMTPLGAELMTGRLAAAIAAAPPARLAS